MPTHQGHMFFVVTLADDPLRKVIVPVSAVDELRADRADRSERGTLFLVKYFAGGEQHVIGSTTLPPMPWEAAKKELDERGGAIRGES